MKKLLTSLCLFATFALAACGTSDTSSASSKEEGNSSVEGTSSVVENTSSTKAAKGTYQFEGKIEEEGSYASYINGAYLLSLDAEGKSTLDKYAFSSYDASPAATNTSYSAAFMVGTWKEVTKEGLDCLQIKLAFDDGSNATTYYAYESEGEYSFDLTVPLSKGQSFTRTAEMKGKKGSLYANADAFIQAYKKEFVEPENVLKVESLENDGAAYFQEDGNVLIYVATSNIASGTYKKTATSLTLTIDDDEIPVTLSATKGSFEYEYNLAGYSTIVLEFEFPIADFAKIPETEEEETLPEGVLVELEDGDNDATLTFNKDKTYTIKVAFAGYGTFTVQEGAWSFANYTVTLTPSSGDPYRSSVSAEGQFIVATHITWGGGSVNKDLSFSASQNIIGTFMQA